MIKVGINGFGRIGSLAFRAAVKSDDIEVVAINAPGHPASHIAYCVKYDSVHGRFDGEVVGNDEDSTVTVKLYRPRNGLKEIPGILRGYEDGKVTIEAGKEVITFEKSAVALVRLRVEF